MKNNANLQPSNSLQITFTEGQPSTFNRLYIGGDGEGKCPHVDILRTNVLKMEKEISPQIWEN